MKSKYNYKNILIFIVSLIALYAIQREVVTPGLIKIATSDFFLDESRKRGNLEPITDNMTNYAHMHCNRYIEEEFGDDLSLNFIPQPINAWNTGADSYVINAEVEASRKEDGKTSLRRFACQIKYDEGDGANYENWKVEGLSGLEDL